MIQFDEHIFQMGWFNHQLAQALVFHTYGEDGEATLPETNSKILDPKIGPFAPKGNEKVFQAPVKHRKVPSFLVAIFYHPKRKGSTFRGKLAVSFRVMSRTS